MTGTGDDASAVQLRSVTKRFGDFTAVDDVSLEIRRGEFITLLGPSGCGKTTSLRMIAGFEQPTIGRVLIDGADVTDVPPHKRSVNTVFQSYALFPHLTVLDNVAFGLRRRGTGKRDAKTRALELIELVGLAGFERRKPSQLSGGQQQRVALARALVNNPPVLLLDEPLGALDLKLRRRLQIELKQIQRSIDVTFVFVTHDQEEALTMSDRIAVMNQGVIEQIGDPQSIYERPLTPFVADFIGTSNLLPATADAQVDGRHRRVVVEGGATMVGELVAGELAVGDDCAVVVRPEKLGLWEAGDAAMPEPSAGPPLSGQVADTIYLGTTTQYRVRLTSGQLVTVLEQNSERATRATAWGPGDDCLISWSPEHVLLLPGKAPTHPVGVEEELEPALG